MRKKEKEKRTKIITMEISRRFETNRNASVVIVE
jgi:hypothetical protein